ncbi:MAG: dolichyl-phosphate beta-glucosyltransferase [Acidobacteriota bacterium]|nr:dolichyl-phosphate beta-glucosyltransferase [Acidobacteriota bacterium]
MVSVVVPAYNEETRLGGTLPVMIDYLESRPEEFEIVVVDDGSVDATSEVAQGFASRGVRLVRLIENQGKGAALRAGALASRGDRALLTDADLSTPISELETLEPHLADFDIVIASRAVAGSTIDDPQPLYRQWMGKTFNLMTRLFLVSGIHDTQCGFKLLGGEVARRLFGELYLDGFAYDVELLWLARRHGYRIAEVGVRWDHKDDSRVQMLADPIRMAVDLVRFRLHHALRRT